MNLPQRIVLALGAIAVVTMALFPPWVFVFETQLRVKRFAGYYPIWESNAPTDAAALGKLFSMASANPRYFSIQIDSVRLGIQIAVVLIVTALATALLKSKKS